jgi:hypothetical protein
MANLSPGPAGIRGERKVFFSEEKKQKTFDFSSVCAAWTVRGSIG